MNVTDILVDSPNGYRITADEPAVVDEAIRYYLVLLEKFPLEDYPVEHAMVNYGMGKLLLGDKTKPKISEERAKRIENALYHLNQALHVFNHSDYPIMFGLISIMMARLFRERATLISNRSFLAERSSPEDSVLYGVDQILEAFPIFFRSKAHMVEHALCSLEAGWLYLLQAEFLDNFRDDSIKEQAAMYLERSISLVHAIADQGDKHVYTCPGEKHRRWNPLTSPKEEFPEHVQLLLEGQPFAYIEGSALYLLGRLYQGWTELNVADYADVKGNFDRGRHKSGSNAAESFELQNQIKAFDYFTQAVRTKFLPKECFLWADAHHRAAVTLIKYPKVVNPDYVENDTDVNASDIHLEVAITHLVLALRCPALTAPAAMDLHFHLAQTAISRLQLIIDRVPVGQSVTKALMAHSEGMELIRCIEEHLEEARKRVTPASTQTTQDGYLYFFSCLKISEYRMLEAACRPELKAVEREDFLTDAVEHLVDALKARTLTDNTDLHYVATVQMSQLLLAAKRSYAAAKSYGKCLFVLSLIINRSLYNPEDVQEKLSEETVRQVGQSLAAGARDVPWVKLHFGPISLNERLTAGYASWSFEDAPSVKISQGSSSALFDMSGGADESIYKPQKGQDEASSVVTGSSVAIYKASPPKGVPPLKLPVQDNKKVYVTGEIMHTDVVPAASLDPIVDASPDGALRKKPPPPAGPVPLFALGHTPQYDHKKAAVAAAEASKISSKHSGSASNYYLGPYGRRMRRRIPPTKQMFDIDKTNLQTFGMRNGKPNFLLPSHIKKRGGGGRSKPIDKGVTVVPKPSSYFTGASALKPRAATSSQAASSGDHKEAGQDGEGGDEAGEEQGSENAEEVGGSQEEGAEGGEQEEEEVESRSPQQEVITRGRSATIRPDRGPLPSSGAAPAAGASGDRKGGVKRKRGVLSWLFGGKKDKTAAPTAAVPAVQKKKVGFSLFGLFGRGNDAGSDEDEEDDSLEMWASPQCFYTYNVLSRQSRMQLVLRCSKLEALDGERTNFTLFNMKPKYLNTYYGLKKLLTKDCAKLVVPPVSMKDLSSRPFLELQALFSSQVRICRKLDDFEHLLYNKISKHDAFLPFITCAPVFTRDLAGFDKGLLDAEGLIMNLANEATLFEHNAHLRKQQRNVSANTAAADLQGGVDDALSKSQFAYDSVSSAHVSTVGEATAVASLSSQQKQRQEEAEEVAVGKVTLSLSQCLDGSNYLIGGQQGSRDMLERCVAQDECLMVWHLPVVPSQPLQVVLVWRDHSASLHNKYSSSSPTDPTDLLPGEHNRRKTKKSASAAKVKGGQGKDAAEDHNKGIIMEIAKSDLDTSHLLQYIQGYLDALHSQSTPLRATMTSDALRALSCALSLTEFLHMIPPHIKSLVICCPSALRVIPWHLLLIEQASNTPFAEVAAVGSPEARKPREIHLMEKFCVRLGPSLALFELNEMGSQALRHSAGLHRLCAIDGEADGPDRSAGVRGTDLEVACVSTVWSADPGDYRVLSNDGAVPRAVQTVVYGDGSNEDYKQFKQDIYIKRRDKVDHTRVVPNGELDGDFVGALAAEHAQTKKERRQARRERRAAAAAAAAARLAEGGDAAAEVEEVSESSSSSSSEEEEEESGKPGRKKRQRKLTASDHDQKAITMCRVLHISAPKVPLSDMPGNAKESTPGGPTTSAGKLFAAISLPRYDSLQTFRDPKYKAKLLRRNRDEREDDARDRLTARDVVQQLFVKNCALCTLSRYALTDDLLDIRSAAGWSACDTNCEFLEALHLAGAKTVLHPLWSGNATGLAAVAHLVFLVRFYSTLPANSRHRLSIVETCRSAQLWLKDATADAIIAFIQKAPLPKAARQVIIDELEAFVTASLTPAQLQLKLEAQKRAEQAGSLAAPNKFISPEKNRAASPTLGADGTPVVFVTGEAGEQAGNRIGGTVKFFSHFMYWGSFAISGSGSAVHHPDLTENPNEGFEQGHIRWDDKELNNMSFEASMLRMEGKISEAKELEKLIRQVRLDRIRKQIAAAKATGARAGRGIMDTLDFLDKALLDQDSDEVSVSDDSEEERRKRKARKQNKARESDSDEYSEEGVEDGRGAGKAGPTDSKEPEGSSLVGSASTEQKGAPALSTPSKKFVPRALELGSMKPEDIAYEKWKSKVGGLNMIVRDPVLQPRKATPGKNADSYEYNMMKKVKESAEKDEPGVSYDERMEALYQRKEKSKGRRLEKGAKGAGDSSEEGEGSDRDAEDQSDDESDDDLSAAARKAMRRTQMRNADRDSESEYDPSEDEVQDEEGSDDEGLYAQRKKLRKKKDRRKAGKAKKMSRFAMALQDVRGGVRSYSSVVKSITNQVPDKKQAAQMIKSALLPQGEGGNHGSEDEDAGCVVC